MSLVSRIVYLGLIGLAVGLIAWPLVELVVFNQSVFPNMMVFSLVAGSILGMVFGAGFGISEGIIGQSVYKLVLGVPMGLLFGAIGGALGTLGGQAVLLLLGSRFFNTPNLFYSFGFPFSRSIGWAFFGVFIGAVEGIRSRSLIRLRNGLIGGAIGGFLGGLLFEYIKLLYPEAYIARLFGLGLLGVLIGIAYGLVEKKLSDASLYLLNGPQKGSEFLLTRQVTTLGKSAKEEIGLTMYNDVEEKHIEITKVKDSFILTDAGTKTGTFVNDDQIKKRKLKDGDVLRVGDAQFQFRRKF
ncbi:MAG: FHA domain-containing protein [Spirochaetales bacterium]|nr:FHA domain-containing protein [Spirochaetales bacterium]